MFQVIISFARIILSSICPRIETLGRIQGTDIFCSKRQYPTVSLAPGLMIIHIGTSFLCFINANFTRERYENLYITIYYPKRCRDWYKMQKNYHKNNHSCSCDRIASYVNIEGEIQFVVIDMSSKKL